MSRYLITWLAAVACLVGGLSQAAVPAALAGLREQPLHNGIQSLTLAGHPATAVLAWRENYNAHGFAVLSFYATLAESGAAAASSLNLLPVFGGPGEPLTERLVLTEGGGADCLLHDVRLLQDARGRSVLLVASRDAGASDANAAAVHFDLYPLVESKQDLAGQPPLSFRWSRRIEAAKPYCDVDEAISQELGYP